MASNVYTKNEILQNLASRGYFIDSYTLDTFFEKWKVEAIFEDEQGSEFYDKNALDLVLDNLFGAKGEPEPKNNINEEPVALKNPQPQPQFQPQMPVQPQFQQQFQPQPQFQQQFQPQGQPTQPQFQPQMQPQGQFQQSPPVIQPTGQENTSKISNQASDIPNLNITPEAEKLDIVDEKLEITDDAANILSNISLSDGTPLINKIQETSDFSAVASPQIEPVQKVDDIKPSNEKEPEKPGILEGAMQAAGKEYAPSENAAPAEMVTQGDDNSDFDDISLLSESLEAQEKFRQYVVSELAKKNVDLNPKGNEFKLDISERTISMIARTMAKKIAKHVNTIFSADAKNAAQLENIKEENKKLEQRSRNLEEQNKKLRLLLAESNKNLNSYKPSIFGLYKKVKPEK